MYVGRLSVREVVTPQVWARYGLPVRSVVDFSELYRDVRQVD
ncbi:hypothetical protein [Rhodococcus sp. 14-2483-1-2]|nr:hypothetical protein [Rhodococcus sp. 14-2483-1-2]